MDGTRFIVAGTFIDGSGAEVRRNVFLAVKDGIITAIGRTANLPSADRAVVDDFSHCIILPALVDCSVSLSSLPSVDERVRASFENASLPKRAAIIEQHIMYCHMHGVQAVADCDDTTDLVKYYLEGAAQANIIDIRTSGRFCRGLDDCADGNSDERDFLKIVYSDNIEGEKVSHLRLDRQTLSRILLRKGGKKAVVVANGPQQVNDALEAGCDAIEQGYGMGDSNLKKMADMAVLWIPNLLRAKNALDGASASGNVCCRFSTRYVAPGKPVPGADVFWKKTLNEQLRQLQSARELGVTTALGTGAGSAGILHGESMVEEMKLFIKAGYSLEETVRSASENGARFFGMEKLGKLTEGQKATFLIARGTMQQLPRKLSYLEGIYVDGEPSTVYRKNPVKTV